MASYSVAAAKDQLSRLIDRALAGEEVIVTRHGKPTVTIKAVDAAPSLADRAAAMEELRKGRESRPPWPRDVPMSRFRSWLYEEDEEG